MIGCPIGLNLVIFLLAFLIVEVLALLPITSLFRQALKNRRENVLYPHIDTILNKPYASDVTKHSGI